MSETRRVVLGIGNILNRDEGVGVHALEALAPHVEPDSVELIDGGVLGLNLLPVVEECSHLLVLDAIDARTAPGTIIEMSRDEIPLFSGVKMSEHQITFQEVLGLARVRGKLPAQLHLVGVQPDDISIGLGMGDTVAAAMPAMVDRAVQVLREWGLVAEHAHA